MILVTNEMELQAAAAGGDVDIGLDREITVTGGIYFSPGHGIVRIVGLTANAGIKFVMKFNGDWSTINAVNGLELNCRQAILRGLHFRGYEMLGSVVKGHVTELLDISDCRFGAIGTIQFPPKVDPPKTANDTLFNQCISSHQIVGGHISVVGCQFRRCVLNNRDWSHCIYVSARSVAVLNNHFDECGSAFAVGAMDGGSMNVSGNEIQRPQAVQDRNGVTRPTYLAGLGAEGRGLWMDNGVRGAMGDPVWTGQPEATRHVVDGNDYGDLTYSPAAHWAANTTEGRWITWEEWLKMGFDGRSRPPVAVK